MKVGLYLTAIQSLAQPTTTRSSFNSHRV